MTTFTKVDKMTTCIKINYDVDISTDTLRDFEQRRYVKESLVLLSLQQYQLLLALQVQQYPTNSKNSRKNVHYLPWISVTWNIWEILLLGLNFFDVSLHKKPNLSEASGQCSLESWGAGRTAEDSPH